MTLEVKDIQAALKESTNEIKNAQSAMAAEVKTNGEATAETKAALILAEEKQQELGNAFNEMDKKLIALELESKRLRENAPKQSKSAGELFVESELFTDLKSSNRGLDRMHVVEKKDITSGAASAGALVDTFRDPTVYRNPNRPLRIRDLIPSIPSPTGAAEFMRQLAFTNNAGAQSAEFAAKGQSNITWELVQVPAATIAHWVPASRQVLSDAPMLRNLIDVDLDYGLQLESDVQLLSGTGTGGDMTGLLVDADIPTVGDITIGTALADVPAAMINHIRSAVTTCQNSEYYNMTGVVLNPTDWERLETAKATDGHYLMIQFPANGADEQIWRMPVIVTNAMPVNTFLLGDWTMGAKIYDKESVEIRVSESHSDYFVKNGVAILAEERYTLGVQRPLAFCKGSFVVAT
jgi:HK97 family phage major capsid protein